MPFFGQDIFKQNIRGKVIDKSSRAPLIGATVVLIDSNLSMGVSTDINGWFVLEDVPVGKRALSISYIGYKSLVLNNMNLESGKEMILAIELEERVKELDEVVVRGYKRKDKPTNDMATVSARSFTVEETEKYAGSWGDPARMATNFAGVANAGDQRNDIVIRGNSPMNLLWKLEGQTIPNPNHFGAMGATGGPISILNNNLLSRSDFYTAAFPAQYGNAISGVFDLNLRNGNRNEFEFLGQTGFNGFELGVEGPFSKSGNASFLANYRYSMLSIFKALNLNIGMDAVPHYQDFASKINFPTSNGRVAVFGMGGLSNLKFEQFKKDNRGKEYGVLMHTGSKMIASGIEHVLFFNQNTSINTRLGFNTRKVYNRNDSLYDGRYIRELFKERSVENRIILSSNVRSKLDSRNLIKIGGSVTNYRIDLYNSYWSEKYDKKMEEVGVNRSDLYLMQMFGEWQHRFNNAFVINSGLHYQHFFYNNSRALEPRLNFKWEFIPGKSISAGYGLHHIMQPIFFYFVKTPITGEAYELTNTNLDFTGSHQFVVGYDHSISKNMRIKSEVYYQHLFDVPVAKNDPSYSIINAGAGFYVQRTDSLLNKGFGKNYGLEFTLEKFLSKNYYYLITASFFESFYKTNGNEWRNTVFNGNFVINALGGYEIIIDNNHSIDINLRVSSAGNRRYIPIDTDASVNRGEAVYLKEKAYGNRLKDYFRIDTRISYVRNGKNVTQEWALDVTNLTDYKNEYFRTWDVEEEKVALVYQQGFLPIAFYRITF
jgi:hypothetical protein